MSFELKPGQSLRKGVRRLARKQMDDALELLTGSQKDRGTRPSTRRPASRSRKISGARPSGLVRPVIGERAFRAENTCFRNAGRPLTEVRDAKILVETLDELARHFKERAAGRSFGNAREALKTNLRVVRKRVLDDEDAFATVGAAVRQARDRVKDWADVPDKWPSIGMGLADVYRTAAAAFEAAAVDPDGRKACTNGGKHAKYLRYQLEVVRPLWPERVQELASEADRMAELLGDDHDLAVLRQMLTDDPERFGDGRITEMLLALIDRRRAELEEDFIPLGQRFFQDGPKEFTRRLKGYWKTWRRRAESEETNAGAVFAFRLRRGDRVPRGARWKSAVQPESSAIVHEATPPGRPRCGTSGSASRARLWKH